MKWYFGIIIFLIAAIAARGQGSGTFDLSTGTGNIGNGFSMKGTVLSIDRDGEYIIQGKRRKTFNSIEVSAGVKAVITVVDVFIANPADCPLLLGEGSDLRLELTGRNIFEAPDGKAGIRTTGAKLTITGDGRLTVKGGAGGGAGIGGNREEKGGDVTVAGGIILSVGGPAGKKDELISRGESGRIKGRYSGGAGIGGGGGIGGIISHGEFNIYNRQLFADAGGQGGSLTITGGKVRAIAGAGSERGYCFGSGGRGSGSHTVAYGAGTAQLTMMEVYDADMVYGGMLILNGSDAILTLDTSNKGTNAETKLLNGTVNGRGAGYLAGYYEEKASDNGRKAIAVKKIAKVPKKIRPNSDLLLTGIVIPETATYKTIVWSIIDAGTTGATLDENILHTAAKGIVKVRAAIFTDEGKICYKQDFIIKN
jgi:hypothetical protein